MFRITKSLISQIDNYLDNAGISAEIFGNAFKYFLSGDQEDFYEQLNILTEAEHKADQLRRDIENALYTHSLIPENRGDVLRLLERLDELINTAKEILVNFDIEKPDIPAAFHQQFLELSQTASQSVLEAVIASKAYFNDPSNVKDRIENIFLLEKKADVISNNLKRSIFNHTELDLGRKMHLRYFTARTDLLADTAETVAEMLSIFAIKLIV